MVRIKMNHDVNNLSNGTGKDIQPTSESGKYVSDVKSIGYAENMINGSIHNQTDILSPKSFRFPGSKSLLRGRKKNDSSIKKSMSQYKDEKDLAISHSPTSPTATSSIPDKLRPRSFPMRPSSIPYVHSQLSSPMSEEQKEDRSCKHTVEVSSVQKRDLPSPPDQSLTLDDVQQRNYEGLQMSPRTLETCVPGLNGVLISNQETSVTLGHETVEITSSPMKETVSHSTAQQNQNIERKNVSTDANVHEDTGVLPLAKIIEDVDIELEYIDHKSTLIQFDSDWIEGGGKDLKAEKNITSNIISGSPLLSTKTLNKCTTLSFPPLNSEDEIKMSVQKSKSINDFGVMIPNNETQCHPESNMLYIQLKNIQGITMKFGDIGRRHLINQSSVYGYVKIVQVVSDGITTNYNSNGFSEERDNLKQNQLEISWIIPHTSSGERGGSTDFFDSATLSTSSDNLSPNGGSMTLPFELQRESKPSIVIEIGLKSDAHLDPIGTTILDWSSIDALRQDRSIISKELKLRVDPNVSVYQQNRKKKGGFFSPLRRKQKNKTQLGAVRCEAQDSVFLHITCRLSATTDQNKNLIDQVKSSVTTVNDTSKEAMNIIRDVPKSENPAICVSPLLITSTVDEEFSTDQKSCNDGISFGILSKICSLSFQSQTTGIAQHVLCNGSNITNDDENESKFVIKNDSINLSMKTSYQEGSEHRENLVLENLVSKESFVTKEEESKLIEKKLYDLIIGEANLLMNVKGSMQDLNSSPLQSFEALTKCLTNPFRKESNHGHSNDLILNECKDTLITNDNPVRLDEANETPPILSIKNDDSPELLDEKNIIDSKTPTSSLRDQDTSAVFDTNNASLSVSSHEHIKEGIDFANISKDKPTVKDGIDDVVDGTLLSSGSELKQQSEKNEKVMVIQDSSNEISINNNDDVKKLCNDSVLLETSENVTAHNLGDTDDSPNNNHETIATHNTSSEHIQVSDNSNSNMDPESNPLSQVLFDQRPHDPLTAEIIGKCEEVQLASTIERVHSDSFSVHLKPKKRSKDPVSKSVSRKTLPNPKNEDTKIKKQMEEIVLSLNDSFSVVHKKNQIIFPTCTFPRATAQLQNDENIEVVSHQDCNFVCGCFPNTTLHNDQSLSSSLSYIDRNCGMNLPYDSYDEDSFFDELDNFAYIQDDLYISDDVDSTTSSFHSPVVIDANDGLNCEIIVNDRDHSSANLNSKDNASNDANSDAENIIGNAMTSDNSVTVGIKEQLLAMATELDIDPNDLLDCIDAEDDIDVILGKLIQNQSCDIEKK